MYRTLVLALLVFASFTVTGSAEGEELRDLLKRLGGRSTTICPLIGKIPIFGPLIGPLIGPIFQCPTSTGTGMMPGGGSPIQKPLSSFNPLACPLMSIFNSVPIIGPMVIQSVNPPLFGCMITGESS